MVMTLAVFVITIAAAVGVVTVHVVIIAHKAAHADHADRYL